MLEFEEIDSVFEEPAVEMTSIDDWQKPKPFISAFSSGLSE